MSQNEILHCSSCNCEISSDDGYFTIDDRILCEDCCDEQTVACENCYERIWIDDDAGDENIHLCQSCRDNYYVSCTNCGRLVYEDSANYSDEDDPYCDSCYAEQTNVIIHDYSYKPFPIFYGHASRYFGVELEIDGGGRDEEKASAILDIGNSFIEQIYIKSDGSLDSGLEIVSHPMTLGYHRNRMPWEDIMETALALGYCSHKTTTCGLHFHVNRSSFGNEADVQEECISRVLFFVEHNWDELLQFSRRTEAQISKWAARYGCKAHPKEVLENAKNSSNGRYSCINLCNWDTIEFRMFRGTLKYSSFIATLELVSIICDLACNITDEEMQQLSWIEFVSSIDTEKYPELITYLKERGLYLNEPVLGEVG